MIVSATIHLEALSEAQIDEFTGRGVHGFWFHRWRQVDEKNGDVLHGSNETQPFTLSPLMGLPRAQHGTIQLKTGATAYFRVTSLTDSLTNALRECWLKGLDGDISVEIPQANGDDTGIPWKVTRVDVDEETSYEELARGHLMNSVPPREWRLEFSTPTTFHGSDGHLPFPLPDSLVNSWLRRWNTFATVTLPRDELIEWCRRKLVVSSYYLRTLPAREGSDCEWAV